MSKQSLPPDEERCAGANRTVGFCISPVVPKSAQKCIKRLPPCASLDMAKQKTPFSAAEEVMAIFSILRSARGGIHQELGW